METSSFPKGWWVYLPQFMPMFFKPFEFPLALLYSHTVIFINSLCYRILLALKKDSKWLSLLLLFLSTCSMMFWVTAWNRNSPYASTTCLKRVFLSWQEPMCDRKCSLHVLENLNHWSLLLIHWKGGLSPIANSIALVLIHSIKNDYVIQCCKGCLSSFLSCADLYVLPLGWSHYAVGI